MKPLADMTLAELIQYAAWQQERWGRILEHLHRIAPALTPQERTARKQAAIAAHNEDFDAWLATQTVEPLQSVVK